MQALAILFGWLFTVAVSLALGGLLLRDTSRDPGVRFVAGAALLSATVFAICAVRMAYVPVFAAAGAGAVVFAFRSRPAIGKVSMPRVAAVLFGVFFVIYFFNAMAPEISFDGSRYHLGLVGRYLREHGFQRFTGSMYASLSQGVEMLFLFAYAFGRHSAAAMVHMTFLVALAWMIYSSRAAPVSRAREFARHCCVRESGGGRRRHQRI